MGRDRDAHISRGNFKMNLTRRDLVQRAAWVLAAAALPGGAELAAEDASSEVSPMMAQAQRLHERSSQRRVTR